MKKLPLILTLASSLLIAACGPESTSSDPAPVSSDPTPVSSEPASSEVTPVAATIADIAAGKFTAGDYVTVSGIITSITTVGDPESEYSSTHFSLQDGSDAVTVFSYVGKDLIIVGDSVTVTGDFSVSEQLPNHLVLYARASNGSLVKSEQAYTYETLTTVSSLEELDAKYGCYASFSPISYVSAVEGRAERFFNVSFNGVEFMMHISASEDEKMTEFLAAIKSGTNFKYEGPVSYITTSSSSRFLVRSLDSLTLLTSEA